MQRVIPFVLAVSVLAPLPAHAQMGGGFIEYVFGGSGSAPSTRRNAAYAPGTPGSDGGRHPFVGRLDPAGGGMFAGHIIDAKYRRQVVKYTGGEPAGTIIVNTPEKLLYLVQGDGTAMRYGIGVGKPGFSWAGTKTVSAKREWPDWRPPEEMLRRRPDLPTFMAGGPENPLGARALYLGSSLYRIHGSNEPWTIGTQVSSGCIRMRNEDVIDLYGRVKVGTKVIVI